MKPLVIICGPTATGKSDLAVDLALTVGGEIINADSMQLYTGMDIGTAKLSQEERRGIPHHLLDTLAVTEAASVAHYQEQAREMISDIQSRDKFPILVGGTGLYIKAVIDEMDFPETDPAIRAKLEEEGELLGAAHLYSRLKSVDPEAAEAIDPANIRRIIRALEVIQVTGKPYSANLPSDTSLRYPDAIHLGLIVDRAVLGERVEARVERMWEKGFVHEIEALIEQGLKEGVTAPRAIGYSHILRALDGEITLDQAREETVIATRQYVRRQETWFKRDSRIGWMDENVSRLDLALKVIEEQLNS
jgi:tRNA dimethylallyltransferase